jgi:hypothetical protein
LAKAAVPESFMMSPGAPAGAAGFLVTLIRSLLTLC